MLKQETDFGHRKTLVQGALSRLSPDSFKVL